jgi:hypothetical protein
MIENRSSPAALVIPVLSYEDVDEASRWLCETFGFRERLRVHPDATAHEPGTALLPLGPYPGVGRQ